MAEIQDNTSWSQELKNSFKESRRLHLVHRYNEHANKYNGASFIGKMWHRMRMRRRARQVKNIENDMGYATKSTFTAPWQKAGTRNNYVVEGSQTASTATTAQQGAQPPAQTQTQTQEQPQTQTQEKTQKTNKDSLEKQFLADQQAFITAGDELKRLHEEIKTICGSKTVKDKLAEYDSDIASKKANYSKETDNYKRKNLNKEIKQLENDKKILEELVAKRKKALTEYDKTKTALEASEKKLEDATKKMYKGFGIVKPVITADKAYKEPAVIPIPKSFNISDFTVANIPNPHPSVKFNEAEVEYAGLQKYKDGSRMATIKLDDKDPNKILDKSGKTIEGIKVFVNKFGLIDFSLPNNKELLKEGNEFLVCKLLEMQPLAATTLPKDFLLRSSKNSVGICSSIGTGLKNLNKSGTKAMDPRTGKKYDPLTAMGEMTGLIKNYVKNVVQSEKIVENANETRQNINDEMVQGI